MSFMSIKTYEGLAPPACIPEPVSFTCKMMIGMDIVNVGYILLNQNISVNTVKVSRFWN